MSKARPLCDDPASGRAGLVLAIMASVVVVACFLGLLGARVVSKLYSIPSASNEPTLLPGDVVLASKWSYGCGRNSFPGCPAGFDGRMMFHPPQRGDLVVFKLPRDGKTDYIKRLIALPGDRVQIKGGVVYVNDRPFRRERLADAMGDLAGEGPPQPAQRYRETTPDGRSYLVQMSPQATAADDTGSYVVPPHCYFVLGDNRDNGADSRFDPRLTFDTPPPTCPWDSSLDVDQGAEGVGFVPEANLVGKVTRVLFSMGSNGQGAQPSGFRRGRFNQPVD